MVPVPQGTVVFHEGFSAKNQPLQSQRTIYRHEIGIGIEKESKSPCSIPIDDSDPLKKQEDTVTEINQRVCPVENAGSLENRLYF
jgi:hypothetical protein